VRTDRNHVSGQCPSTLRDASTDTTANRCRIASVTAMLASPYSTKTGASPALPVKDGFISTWNRLRAGTTHPYNQV
jgi:hypothetical protein